MGFRIMQLQYEPMEEKVNIEQGILLKRPHQTLDLNFVQFISNYTPYEYDLRVNTIHEYFIQYMKDGFEKIVITPPDVRIRVQNEEAIMLIIQYAETIKLPRANGLRIAGRYATEGVFLLQPNERIIVTKGSNKEEFVALRFDSKMYLLKLYNN